MGLAECGNVAPFLADRTNGRAIGTMAAFLKSFQKGFVVCRSLDVNLSGKVAKNDSDTEKRSPRPQCVPPLAIAAYEICHDVTEHG